MIDIENEVYAEVAAKLRNRFPKLTVYSETVLAPSEFPCVCIEEADNYSYQQSRNTVSNENHAVVTYEINVYSNKAYGKKTEAKTIFAVADEALHNLGFTRIGKIPTHLDDATKYRLFGRYTAIVSENEVIYRR